MHAISKMTRLKRVKPPATRQKEGKRREHQGTMSGSSSGSGLNSDSDSDSGSDSGTFKRNVAFKRKTPSVNTVNKAEQQTNERKRDIAISTINSNLKRMEQENANAGDTLLNEEKRLILQIDDTDPEKGTPEDIAEKEAWKERELKRLHKERNMRIEREEAAMSMS